LPEDDINCPGERPVASATGRLPGDTDFDEIMYRLYVFDKIRLGRKDVEMSRTISSEDLKRDLTYR
jgi:hypothetical protein